MQRTFVKVEVLPTRNIEVKIPKDSGLTFP
jgi:hypothetical protein